MPTVASHDRLLADLGATFRPQRHWAEGRGLLLILGHFLSGVGAGTWLFSVWLGWTPGLVLATVVVAASGAAHLAFLGHPERFWRMFKARTSWIARGFLAMNVFLAGAIVTLAAPAGPVRAAGLVLSFAGAAVIIGYKGNVYAASKGVPFWNSPVLPILYAAYALRGGAALLLVALPVAGVRMDLHDVGLIELWIAVSAATMLGFYLAVMRHTNLAARRAVEELLGGRAALAFYLGTVGAGLVVPILIGVIGLVGPLSTAALALIGALSLVGDFFAKYAIARAGVYAPIMPAGRSSVRA
jgi:formate-dependent nitrite reductase membrane component NrfD